MLTFPLDVCVYANAAVCFTIELKGLCKQTKKKQTNTEPNGKWSDRITFAFYQYHEICIPNFRICFRDTQDTANILYTHLDCKFHISRFVWHSNPNETLAQHISSAFWQCTSPHSFRVENKICVPCVVYLHLHYFSVVVTAAALNKKCQQICNRLIS